MTFCTHIFESDSKGIRHNPNRHNHQNLQNKEKDLLEEKKGNIKAFIFIVNIIRIYDSELENWGKKSKKEQKIVKRKILKETISNLSEYYQIFIDNLNGIDGVKLDHIFKNERIVPENSC